MSKKPKTKYTSIGGQALIEGIMMKGPSRSAMSCRLPDGTIKTETEWNNEHGFSNGKVFGTVNRYTNGLLEVTVGGDGYLFPVGSVPVVVYDIKNDEIRSGSMEELVPKALSPNHYSKIFLNAGGGVITDAVIYTNWE